MEKRLAAYDASYDPNPVYEEEFSVNPGAYLPAPDADPAKLVEGADWQDDASSRLGEALDDIDDRSRDILERRWLAEKKTTLQDLADEYGVSAERIRQIETAAIKKLRLAIAA